MLKVMSINYKSTAFMIENTNDLIELANTFKNHEISATLNCGVAYAHIPASFSVQVIAENTEKFRWVGDENVVS